MSIKNYKVLIISLILIICSILLYPVIIESNIDIHGSYVSGEGNEQNIISFDTSSYIYNKYVGGVLMETGTFSHSNINNIIFIDSEEYSSYIILNKDSTFYYVNQVNKDVVLFKKHSGNLISFN